MIPKLRLLAVILVLATALSHAAAPTDDASSVRQQCEAWRAEHRLIDLHQHINSTTQHLQRAVRINDRVGIGVAVNLSGGTVIRGTNGLSAFERNKRLADAIAPGRFVQYLSLIHI